jgi:DNA polymerase zeta
LKILENKVSIQDFIFAREVRMGTYRCGSSGDCARIVYEKISPSDKVPPPPGVIVAARRQLEDPNNEAQYGDRIPYVIARGAPHERLVDRAVAPEELFDGLVIGLCRPATTTKCALLREKQLDGHYYISRILIPPLERIFNLVGADVRGWYEEMPRRIRADGVDASLTSPEKPRGVLTPGRLKIEEHFRNSQCILCRSYSDEGEHQLMIDYVCATYSTQGCANVAAQHPRRPSLDFFRRSVSRKKDSKRCMMSVRCARGRSH